MLKVLVAIFGKSGSGKDTLINEYCNKYQASRIKRTTSRPMRPYESQGNPYHFKKEKDLYQDLMEYTEDYMEVGVFNEGIYCTHKDAIQDGVNLGAFDVDAVEQLCYTKDSDIKIVPIYLYCNDKTRMLRVINRKDDLLEVARRFLADHKKYPLSPEDSLPFDYHSINSEKTIPVLELKKIIDFYRE